MGLRQRLSLAIAVLHEPQILILDEPTSGVDPVARDSFWELLIDLSRKQGVTIFVTTHFMNEGMRCDRISLMNAGKVLVSDAPQKLIEARHAASLEDAFIAYMEDAIADLRPAAKPRTRLARPSEPEAEKPAPPPATEKQVAFGLRLGRMLAYTHNETMQILRDPIRLAFAFVGSALLMLVFGFGITTDVENIRYASLDLDQSPESRKYLEQFAGTPRYFSGTLSDSLLRRSAQATAIGRHLGGARDPAEFRQGLPPRLGPGGSGAGGRRDDVPRRDCRTVRPGSAQHYAARSRESDSKQRRLGSTRPTSKSATCTIPTFESIYSIVPSVPALLLLLIPAILMTVSIVREKELGSMINFYVTPTGRLEYLLGKADPVRRDRHAQFLHSDRHGAARLRRADQGRLLDVDLVHAAVRHDHDRPGDGHFDFHQQPGRGGLRHGDPDHRAHDPVLRLVAAGLDARWERQDHRLRSGRPPTTCTRAWAHTPRASHPA